MAYFNDMAMKETVVQQRIINIRKHDRINSIMSSLTPHSLWVTLYFSFLMDSIIIILFFRYILNLAAATDAVVVSNDNFRYDIYILIFSNGMFA